MESNDLILEWRSLARSTETNIRANVLKRRHDILHRLNELGVTEIDGHSIFDLMEQNNAELRATGETLPELANTDQ